MYKFTRALSIIVLSGYGAVYGMVVDFKDDIFETPLHYAEGGHLHYGDRFSRARNYFNWSRIVGDDSVKLLEASANQSLAPHDPALQSLSLEAIMQAEGSEFEKLLDASRNSSDSVERRTLEAQARKEAIELLQPFKNFPILRYTNTELLEVAAGMDAPKSNVALKLLLYTRVRTNSHSNNVAPLLVAARFGNANAIELLLRAGADINVFSSGLTPLRLAVINGCTRAVQKLLEFGADRNIVNCSGETPLQAAKDEEIRHMLLSGAKDGNS